MPTDWTTVKTFWSVEDAELARGFLEGEGIACQLEGVATAGNFWHLNNASGGIKLKVSPDDAFEASDLLESVDHTHDSDSEESEDDSVEEYADPDEASPGLFEKLRSGRTLLILVILVLAVVAGYV